MVVGPGRFPRRDDYLGMLEEYKAELEEELREVTKELEDLRNETRGGTE